jgi:hypothetical protein
MKRVVNRYGKITVASLGGCLVSIGVFLIVLSSLTVANVARADECEWFDTYQPYPRGLRRPSGTRGLLLSMGRSRHRAVRRHDLQQRLHLERAMPR